MATRAIDAPFLAQLGAALPAGVLGEVAPHYLHEPRGRLTGRAAAIARPQSVAEVACILRHCAQARVGVIPYGGGTGLVGGQVAPAGPPPLLLSLERMAQVRAVYAEENVMIAEAGCILAHMQQVAQEHGRLFPLSLASEGSAQIGGLLSTNAGGVNVLRYGTARDLCLGVEAVLPDGAVLHGLSRLRKNNMGYDLRHLLIGAEGTLGVITAAALRLFVRPEDHATALLPLASPQAALQLLHLARQQVGEAISAFELMHRQGLVFMAEVLPELSQPFAAPPPWCVLVEIATAAGAGALMEQLFASALEAGICRDGVIAQNARQRAGLWSLREHLPEANRRIGAISSHDLSLPLGVIADFVADMDAQMQRLGPLRVNCFGHLGDGNLHYNVYPPDGEAGKEWRKLSSRVTRLVHDTTHAHGGVISAEHGIGRAKVADLRRYGDPAKLHAMGAIKGALDPHGIMNPGALFGASPGEASS